MFEIFYLIEYPKQAKIILIVFKEQWSNTGLIVGFLFENSSLEYSRWEQN